MCNELENAIHAQETLGTDTTKGAMMLMKAAAKSLKKSSERFEQHVAESNQRWKTLETKMDTLAAKVDVVMEDAVKYRLITELAKAMFGSPKRVFTTVLVLCMLLGAVHFSEVLDIVKALI